MLKKKSVQYILNKIFILSNYTSFDITNTNSNRYPCIIFLVMNNMPINHGLVKEGL
jgi:hypothetical protein